MKEQKLWEKNKKKRHEIRRNAILTVKNEKLIIEHTHKITKCFPLIGNRKNLWGKNQQLRVY